MTKEQILSLMKDSILSLKTKGDKLISVKGELIAFKNQTEIVKNALLALNSCDATWLNDEYLKWRRETLSEIDAEIRERLINDGTGDIPKI